MTDHRAPVLNVVNVKNDRHHSFISGPHGEKVLMIDNDVFLLDHIN